MSTGHNLTTWPEVRSRKAYKDGFTCVVVDVSVHTCFRSTGSGFQMTGSHLIWGCTVYSSLLEYFNLKRLKFVTLILFEIVSDGHDVLFWGRFDRYESQIVWIFAAGKLDDFLKTALSMAYRLLLTNMDTYVYEDLCWWRLLLKYGWQDAETSWFERIGVNEPIRCFDGNGEINVQRRNDECGYTHRSIQLQEVISKD